jgi:hypothetical protein
LRCRAARWGSRSSSDGNHKLSTAFGNDKRVQ